MPGRETSDAELLKFGETCKGTMRMAEHRNLRRLLAVALGVCVLGTAGEVGGGESRRGFYVGIEHGLATVATVVMPSPVDKELAG